MENAKNLPEYCSLEYLRKNFTLPELVEMARNENFAEWLAANLYIGEGQLLLDVVENDGSDAEVEAVLCQILGYSFDEISSDELSKVATSLNRAGERIENDATLVEDQEQLARAIWNSPNSTFCLNGGEFKIALGVPNKKYIGFNNAIVDIFNGEDLDLDAQNIILENVQIFKRSNINIKMDNSKNLKIIDGFKKALNENLSTAEIMNVMRGRGSFESVDTYRQRAENLKGVAVGSVLLENSNYVFDEQTFKINPQWNWRFVAVLKDFTAGKHFTLKLSADAAERLYNNERKLQIFADFTFSDRLTIASLYLETASAGRVYLENWI